MIQVPALFLDGRAPLGVGSRAEGAWLSVEGRGALSRVGQRAFEKSCLVLSSTVFFRQCQTPAILWARRMDPVAERTWIA